MKKTKKKLSFTAHSVRALTTSKLKQPQGGLPMTDYCTDSCDCTETCYDCYCEHSVAATYRGCIG